MPIVLPYESADELVQHQSEWDGVVLTGGDFDIDPALFHEAPHPKLGTIKRERSAFESKLYQIALDFNKPVLGICGGMQLMNVLQGGTLIQDIATQYNRSQSNSAGSHPTESGPARPQNTQGVHTGTANIPTVKQGTQNQRTTLNHEQVECKSQAGHSIAIEHDSRLAEILGVTRIGVNSTHHQAIKEVSSFYRCVAKAPDGIVEAIENRNAKTGWHLGVQWHPEAMVDSRQHQIYHAFVKHASWAI